MSKIITQETNSLEEFFIEENPKISAHKIESVTLLQNGPVSTGYNDKLYQLGAGNSIAFQIETSETSFLDSCVALEMTIPFILKKKTAITGSGTDFAKVAQFKDIALKQYGLLNIIDNISCVVNGSLNLSVGNVWRKFAAVSKFYDSETALKKIPESLPDCYTSYGDYATNASGEVKTVTLNGMATDILRPVNYALNIFDSVNSYEFNSRRPVIRITKALTNGDTDIECEIVLRTYIPFSIFSLPDAESTSLYGINSLALNIMLRSDYINHLFAFRTDEWTSASLKGSTSAKLVYKTMNPPSYVAKSMIESSGAIKPYRINLSKIIEGVPTKVGSVPALTNRAGVTGQLALGTIPDRLYIYAMPDTQASSTTPSFYGRPESVSVQIGSSLTTISGADRLYALSIENGLTTSRDVALYTAGFPLCLDLSKDLGLGADVLLNMTMQTNVQITLEFTNLSASAVDYQVCFETSQTTQLVYEQRKFTEYNSMIMGSTDFGADNIITQLYNTYHLTSDLPVLGGSIFSSLFKGLKNIGRYVINNPGKVAKFAQDAYKTITGSGGRGSNVIGGRGAESRTLLLGSGSTKTDSIFK